MPRPGLECSSLAALLNTRHWSHSWISTGNSNYVQNGVFYSAFLFSALCSALIFGPCLIRIGNIGNKGEIARRSWKCFCHNVSIWARAVTADAISVTRLEHKGRMGQLDRDWDYVSPNWLRFTLVYFTSIIIKLKLRCLYWWGRRAAVKRAPRPFETSRADIKQKCKFYEPAIIKY